MPFCAKCGKEVSGDMEFCSECGWPLSITQESKKEVNYNKALRWLSGVLSIPFFIFSLGVFIHYAEPRMRGELIMDVLTFVIGSSLLSIAIVPRWISSTFKIKLGSTLIFTVIVTLLVLTYIVATIFGLGVSE